MIGSMLGHYRVIEKVGEGGMGVVYRTYDEQLDRDVAIKILPQGALGNESSRRRFHKEALTLAKLNHLNIETVYEFGSQDGVDFVVLEYVAGSITASKWSAPRLSGAWGGTNDRSFQWPGESSTAP